MTEAEIEQLLEDEWYIVRNSGEIPEIAYNASCYYLSRAAGGPRLVLRPEHLEPLLQAAVMRYREIILRDLDHANLGTTIYRGISRSKCNYERFCRFCIRNGLEPQLLRIETREALLSFCQHEVQRLAAGKKTVIDLSTSDLIEYGKQLGVADTDQLIAPLLHR